MVADSIHYLATLDRKPRALDHSPVHPDWELSPYFAEFRTDLEQHHSLDAGAGVLYKCCNSSVNIP